MDSSYKNRLENVVVEEVSRLESYEYETKPS